MLIKKENRPDITVIRDQIEVTSLHRPDISWKFTDGSGHIHQWYDEKSGSLAESYRPTRSYHVPSVVWIKTGVGYYPDGSSYDVGYHACRQCGQEVDPRYTADTYAQYIPGIAHFYIDDVEVSLEEAERVLGVDLSSHIHSP